jgi:hypothetical protein
VEWYTTRESAARELAVIVADEPGWVEVLEIVLVEFGGAGDRVEGANLLGDQRALLPSSPWCRRDDGSAVSKDDSPDHRS